MVRQDLGRIGVLMGGVSEEREISLKSGRAVYNTLKEAGFDVIPVDIDKPEIRENIKKIRSSGIDVAFIALHGRFGEDGTIQKILEDLNIPYTGSGVEASRLALNKVLSRRYFIEWGLNVPEYRVIEKKEFNKNLLILEELKFPLVIKPSTQGSSIGLFIVENRTELLKAVEEAFNFDDRIIIEQYIKGREVTVGILEEQPLPIIEIIPKKRFFDYEAKYTPGLTEYIIPAEIEEEITKQIRDSALRAHKALGCYGFSRVDMILKEDYVYVLEVNTIPGLTETSLLPKAARAIGIDFLELCLRLIDSAYRKSRLLIK
ncbi:MAG: D-alanine--D-alanine ligase [Candidatus Omnitrophica bacterium]|nr:D-alanine--D-alanine ligase [Candidatus Omnitrophota bacterium]